MKLILNEKLDAIEWLESHQAAGLTLQLDSKVKTAIIQGGDYIHARSLVELVKLLKRMSSEESDS